MFFQTSSAAAQDGKKLFKGEIVIGTAIWPGYLCLYLAAEKGYFKDEGLDVKVLKYTGLASLSRDYLAGKMQGRADLVYDAVKEFKAGLDHKAVLAIDYSNGSDAILARKDLPAVSDFKGKQVGYEFGTLEEFFLKWALEDNAMQLSDIIPVNADPEQAAKLLKEGKIDAAVTYEPFVSRYVSSGDFHVVYSSADVPGLITDILTFRTEFIEAYPGTVEAVLKAYFRALKLLKVHPDEAYAIMARQFEGTPRNFSIQLGGVRVLDERDNLTAFTFSTGLESLYGNMRRVARFIEKNGGERSSISDTDKLVERRFIKAINDR